MKVENKIKMNIIAITIGVLVLLFPMQYREELFLLSWVMLALTSTVYVKEI